MITYLYSVANSLRDGCQISGRRFGSDWEWRYFIKFGGNSQIYVQQNLSN